MKIKYTILIALFMFQLNGMAQDKLTAESITFYDGVSVFPNPATENITVLYGTLDHYQVGQEFFPQVWVDFEYKGSIDIVSNTGEVILQNIQLSKETHKIEIPIHELRSGLYFLVFRFDDREPVMKKIVVL